MQGEAGSTSEHAHYAHQYLLAAAPMRIRVGGEERCGPRLLIESMQAHAVLESIPALLNVFAEPATLSAAALAQALEPLDPDPLGIAAALCDARRPLADPRLRLALETVDASLADLNGAQPLAAKVRLSLSQLERLFAAQVGIPVRPLLRWRRLRFAIALALQGQSLTVAAHAAGFSDSAHFSRTMRRLFGVRADLTLRHLRVHLLD
nr:helix-turn-helix domain-containing protein [Pseudomonas sp. RIT-PI-AD]